jgi:hypothetical protein
MVATMKKYMFYLLMIVFSSLNIYQNIFGSDLIEKEVIKKTLIFSKSPDLKELAIDNICGSIEVFGEKRKDVLLVIHKKIKARSAKKLEQAKREIQLDISEENNVVSIYVDAPFRKQDGSIRYRGYRHQGYEVTFNFEVKIPRDTDIFLKTVNDGEISVEDVRGDYEVNNINGGITMLGLAGSGKVYAVNGEVKLDFVSNPKSDCYFGSLNGDVDIEFQKNFAADLLIKTFNGDVYTDFPVTYLPHQAIIKKKKGKKFVYKTSSRTRVRVGKGGPKIELDGFNGDINVLKK